MRSEMRSVVAAALLLVACGVNSPPPTAPTQPSPAGSRVVLPDGFTVHVEVAADDATRQQGLMYRDTLPENRGMLFFFASTGNYPFWMKNTLIPLDMIWIDDQKRIAHIAAAVPPCKADPCPSVPPDADARYVLELASGVAARHGLANGQTLRFEGMENVVIR
jgi:uncharacterized membrane protein (UPF0127 family)